MKRLLEKKEPLIPSDLWQEIERLKERNRQIQLKKGEERRANIEKVSELERQVENLMRRNQLAQAERDEARANYDALLESSTAVTKKLEREMTELRSQLEILQSAPSATPLPEFELPDALSILNELRAERKPPKTDKDYVKAILGIIERLTPDKGN